MFTVVTVKDGVISVTPKDKWTDVIPLIKVGNIRVKEDGKLILLVRRKLCG